MPVVKYISSLDFEQNVKFFKVPKRQFSETLISLEASVVKFGLRFNIYCLFFFILLGFLGEGVAQESFTAKVSKIIDGDSVVITYRKKNIQLRLWGIDCPEWNQPYSQEAKQFTKQFLKKRKIVVIPKDWDKYGRLVAIVEVGGRCINQELVKAGFAWVHIYYCREKICKKWRVLEKKSRQQGIGLWHNAEPIAPWKWKRMQSQ